MKRLLSIVLAVVMVMSLSLTAFAAGEAVVSVSSATAEPGTEVTLNFNVSGEFANYEFYITVESPITLVSIDGVTGNPANGKVAFAKDSNVNGHGFTATFAVPADIAAGEYAVGADIDFVADADLEDLDVSVSGGVIIIEGEPETEHVHAWGEWTETKAATCTEAGVETRTCACGESETREIAALGHAWGEWEVTKEATCTEAGVETRICSACKETESREIAMIDHEFGAWTFCGTEDKHEHEMVCSMCGKAIVAACNDVKVGENKEDDKIIEEWQCVDCGHTFIIEKDLPDVPVVDPNLDDVPKTGDITTQVVMTGAAALVAMMAAVAFIFKRKAAK